MAEQDVTDAHARSTQLLDLARRLIDAWNRGDSCAFASLFTPAAEYVTAAGERLRGRQAISQLLEKAAPPPQVRVVGEPIVECDTRFGRLSFAWSIVEASGPARRGRIACVCVRQESAWLIEALHNDDAGPVVETRGSPTSG